MVHAYDPKPSIRIKASDQPDQSFRRYGFVDAIKELDPFGTLGLLDQDFKVVIFSQVGYVFLGVVLSSVS